MEGEDEPCDGFVIWCQFDAWNDKQTILAERASLLILDSHCSLLQHGVLRTAIGAMRHPACSLAVKRARRSGGNCAFADRGKDLSIVEPKIPKRVLLAYRHSALPGAAPQTT
jgi:hypothetical protein